MRTKLSGNDIAGSGAKATGEGTADEQPYEIPGEQLRDLLSKVQTLEVSLAELRSSGQDADAGHLKLQADYVTLTERFSAERTAFEQVMSAWSAERETLLGSRAALEHSVADLNQANISLNKMFFDLRHDIEVMSASLQSGKSELALQEEAIHELKRRLQDSVRKLRNSEEYARQVMLELLRVRQEQEATQQRADAATERAALSGRQLEETQALLRKSESTRLEMEQTPGWWLIRSFQARMRRSPRFATAIGLVVKAARGLRLLPAGSPWEVQWIAPLVDQEYYFRTYPEAKELGIPAAEHYFRLGAAKGYNPSADFDTRFYLTQYPDVASAGVNPLQHYAYYGANEGRRTHPDPQEPPASEPAVAQVKQLTTPADSSLAPEPVVDGRTSALETIQLRERFAIRPHRELVSIIVTVHNALEHVRPCLTSVLRQTLPPYELVLVDDGSDPPTCEFLRGFAAEHSAVLIRSETASGYTFAANRGLRAARGEYIVLLNSDTIVTENWLDRMVMCAESDPHIGIVGPLSNRANWQSIPEVVRDGKWADNELPENWTVQDMARAVAAFTGRTYPRIPFLNGFCLLMKREVLEAVGYFDEVNFGRGYGEENDYGLRARAKGWGLAVADDAYVHHDRTRSYSIERRDELSEVAHRMLYTKHKKSLIDQSGEQARDHLVLFGIRARAGQMFARQTLMEEGRRRWQGKRIAFLLPVGEQCAAADTVLAEAKAMETFGVSVLIVNLRPNMPAFRSAYPETDLEVVFVPGEADVPDAVRGYDTVVATTYDSVFQLRDLAAGLDSPTLAHYIQDFEPNFFPPGSDERQNALSSYSLIPNIIRFTKTAGNRDEVLRRAGVNCAVVGPSCDIDLFRPRVVPSGGKLNLCAKIGPSWPSRAARETLEFLAEVDRQHRRRVSINVFGVDSSDPVFADLPSGFQWTNQRLQTRAQRAAWLSGQDIFVDLFHPQSMGPATIEAMASGAVPVLSQMGDCGAFAVHGENALIVDPSDHTACWKAIGSLIEDGELLAKLRRRAVSDVVRYWPEQAAFNILSDLFLERTPAPLPGVSYLTTQV